MPGLRSILMRLPSAETEKAPTSGHQNQVPSGAKRQSGRGVRGTGLPPEKWSSLK